jgi:hypothetical protein
MVSEKNVTFEVMFPEIVLVFWAKMVSDRKQAIRSKFNFFIFLIFGL